MTTAQAQKETLGFQTEVKQLLKLMIHSLYSNKEIFLRELISNASDACDKLRFEGLKDQALYENDSDLGIYVGIDKDARTLTIRDNGIGMSREEVIDNIGTIAKSGTKQFFDALSGDQAKDAQLIGQFGVGFYSAFIVADKVTLRTRRAGMGIEHGVEWESSGEGDYTLQTIEKATRGTEIVLHLRADDDEFLESYRVRSIIRRYSDHISLPITMDKQGDEAGTETVNQASALWKRAKSDISEADYNEFYKHLSHDYEDPLAHVHTHVEGNQSYSSLFYIPEHAPFDLWDREQRKGIKLYVKRVFIMDESEHLMPAYLRFVRGLVDSDDLPLNVSREILQRNKNIDAIRGASVKKVLGLLETLSQSDAEKYASFWKEFGNVLKEGPAEDPSSRDRIAKLLRFASTQSGSEEQTVSLADYLGRMKEGQDKIYYITADSYAAAKNSPHLEVFRKKGLEVLLMSDRVDEWLMSYLTEFEGKSFQSVAKGDLDLGKLEDEAEKAQHEKEAKQAESVVKRLQTALGDKVKEVRVTHRLTNSPTCLVVQEQDMAANLQRMLKAAGHAVPTSLPTLEVNPTHPLILRLDSMSDESQFGDWAQILFDQAILAEGGQLEDPTSFVSRLNLLLVNATA
ncbi:MAG: molecular chaperone HtpG [Gammaproteobacteria bacterium]|nr:molecular chaperone HtpG [Gammaproteobacteria bacterium]